MFPQTIIIIGASSVFGMMDTEGGFTNRLARWHRASNLDKNRIYNLGIPGDTTDGMLARFDAEVSVRKPDAIVFSLGSNDSSRLGAVDGDFLVPLERYRENVKQLILKAQSHTKTVVFVSAYPINEAKTQPLPGNGNYYLEANLEKYVSAVGEICKEMDIPLLNIYDQFLADFPDKEFLFEDGLHCNTKGHERIFRETTNFLERLWGQHDSGTVSES